MRALLCHLLGHRWRRTMEQTHIVTGAGTRRLRCARCPATRMEAIPARSESP